MKTGPLYRKIYLAGFLAVRSVFLRQASDERYISENSGKDSVAASGVIYK